ncbi:uncharacterized protein isoform X1 [Danio rerio]|uniref:Uncharacterized protein isoform X1 n=1 Tax=Danio rerio TaxID=7955 RepID=A0AC58JDB2_DANRE
MCSPPVSFILKNILTSPSLTEESLKEIVKSKWFGQDQIKQCVNRQKLAQEENAPLSVESKIGVPPTKRFISVYEPNISYYSRLGRVMVSYDTKKNSWHCPCAKTQRSCTHKYIAKWHLFQIHPELFRKVRSTESAEEFQAAAMEESDESDNYPPKDIAKVKSMVEYILMNKKLPSTIPSHLRLSSDYKEFPKHLIPDEIMCYHCSDRTLLSDPVCITRKAKILTTTGIVQDVSTYYKLCPFCGMVYRYQEWANGLHNFNDHVLLELSLCLTIRNLLQVHTAVSRVVEYLEVTTGVQFPLAVTLLHGYLHFEALTDHEYEYSCVSCGDHPPVVIMDLHKKASFHLSVSDLSQPPQDFNGEVDLDMFWKALTEERIARGFFSSQKNNPFCVTPSYNYWAPWIGSKTRIANVVLNTEFEKVHKAKTAERTEITVSEDRLKDELLKQKVGVIRRLCQECGLDAKGSRTDLLLRLSEEMRSREAYDKVFEKIWAASENPSSTEKCMDMSLVPITEKTACEPTTLLNFLEPTKPWERDWHPLQEKLLDYVLDRNRPGSEIIVKEGQVCLIREEFWSLGLLRDMDSHIGNACMKLICEMARQIGKDIYIEDFYVVPVWKETPNNIVTGLPEDADLKDLLAFPAWTNANGPDHFVVCIMMPLRREMVFLDSLYAEHESGFGDEEYRAIFRKIAYQVDHGTWSEKTGYDFPALPRQTRGNDCGVFVLMYTVSMVCGIGFQFQEMDIPIIRQWWCLLLMERF